MNYLKFARFSVLLAAVSALSGCFVSAGGSTGLDPSNPYGPQVGGQVTYDVRSGALYPGLSIGAGPIYIGL